MNDALGETLGAMIMLLGPMVIGSIWIVCSNLIHERRTKKRREARELKKLRRWYAEWQQESD